MNAEFLSWFQRINIYKRGSDMNKEVYDLAHKLADEWCYKNQLLCLKYVKTQWYVIRMEKF